MRWLADECFDNDIIRALWRHSSEFDIVRAQDIPEIAGRSDGELLSWATEQRRIVLTHDISTMPPARVRRMQQRLQCSPVVLVQDSLPIASVAEEILLLDRAATESDWAAGIIYLPLR